MMSKRFLKIMLCLLLFQSCNNNSSDSKKSSGGATYVSPSIDKYGRFKKGHVRFPISTKAEAFKNRLRSKYYYRTRGKFRAKKKR